MSSGNAECLYCGFGIAIIPPTEGTPARLVFENCPQCRDRFAMAALAGFGCGVDAKRMAELCYEVADAMLAERGKK